MKEISTYRQQKNGTRIFQLPIKKYGQYIEVGSFESGYVRRMNGCYTPYQLNKCENVDHFYKEYKSGYYNDGDYHQRWTGKYTKYVGKRRITIDNELDRLEYLIAYCLKNYYINQANMIENGNYITKWKHEWEMKNGNIDKVRELQKEVTNWKNLADEWKKRFEETVMELDELTVTVNGHKYKVI